MPFQFTPVPLAGLIAVTPTRFGDSRGWFSESYKSSEFSSAGIEHEFVQDNMSKSGAGVLRGLHYQLPPHAQGKLVQVLRGRVWDVAVDIRKGSKTFGQWYGMELGERDGTLFWVPPGFAHGFLALENNTLLSYKCTAEYHSASERSILYSDNDLAITWPKIPGIKEYQLSSKDQNATHMKDAEVFP